MIINEDRCRFTWHYPSVKADSDGTSRELGKYIAAFSLMQRLGVAKDDRFTAATIKPLLEDADINHHSAIEDYPLAQASLECV